MAANPDEIEYLLNGKKYTVSKDEFNQYSGDFMDQYPEAQVRMKGSVNGEDIDEYVPVRRMKEAFADGLHLFTIGHGVQAKPKAAAPNSAQPTGAAQGQTAAPNSALRPGTLNAEQAESLATATGVPMLPAGAPQPGMQQTTNVPGQTIPVPQMIARPQEQARQMQQLFENGTIDKWDTAQQRLEERVRQGQQPLSPAAQAWEDSNPAAQWAKQKEQERKAVQKEEERRNTPIGGITGNKTYGQAEDEAIATLDKKYVQKSTAVDDAVAEAQKIYMDAYNKAMEGAVVPAGAIPSAAANLNATIRAARAASDEAYGKITERLSAAFEQTLATEEFMQDCLKQANIMGYDPHEYMEKVVRPMLRASIQEKLNQTMIAENMPKSELEYIMRGVEDGLIGKLVGTAVMNPAARQWRGMANQQSVMEHTQGDSSFDAGHLASYARTGVMFGSDALAFMATGGLASAGAKKILGDKVAQLVAQGFTETQAGRLIASELVNAGFAQRAANMVMNGVVSGALNLGMYNAASETARQAYEGRGMDVGKIAEEAGKGALTGAALGVGGGLTGAAAMPLSGAKKFAANLLGFGVETGIFTGVGEVEKYLAGETDQIKWGKDFIESGIELAVMKVANPEIISKIVNARNALKESPFKLADTEREELGQSEAARNFFDALNKLDAVAKSKAGKKSTERAIDVYAGVKDAKEEAQKNLYAAYNSLMMDPDVSWGAKMKLAKAFNGSVPEVTPEVATYSLDPENMEVRLYDKNGSLITRQRCSNPGEYEARAEEMQQLYGRGVSEGRRAEDIDAEEVTGNSSETAVNDGEGSAELGAGGAEASGTVVDDGHGMPSGHTETVGTVVDDGHGMPSGRTETTKPDADASGTVAATETEAPKNEAYNRGVAAIQGNDRKAQRQMGRSLKVATARLQAAFPDENAFKETENKNIYEIDAAVAKFAAKPRSLNAQQLDAVSKWMDVYDEHHGAKEQSEQQDEALRQEARDEYNRVKKDDGTVEEALLDSGEAVHVKSGNVETDANVIVQKADGSTMSVPSNRITKRNISKDEGAFIANKTADQITTRSRDLIETMQGKTVAAGDEVEIAIGGEVSTAKVVGRDGMANVILELLSDGSQLPLKQEALVKAVADADNIHVAETLANENRERRQAEAEAKAAAEAEAQRIAQEQAERRAEIEAAKKAVAEGGSAEHGAKSDGETSGTVANDGHGIPSGQTETEATAGSTVPTKKELLDSYETEEEATAAVDEMLASAKAELKPINEQLSSLNAQLDAHVDGSAVKTADELQQIVSSINSLEAKQKELVARAQQIDTLKKAIPTTYKARTEAAMTPAAKRERKLRGITNYEQKFKAAQKAYTDSPLALEYINDDTVRSAEELVSRNLPLRSLNWEGKGVDEIVHDIYESGENQLPDGGHMYEPDEIQNALYELLSGASKPSDISLYGLDRRIDEAEAIMQREEAYEAELQEKAQWEALERQKEEEAYMEHIESTLEEVADAMDQYEAFFEALNADTEAMWQAEMEDIRREISQRTEQTKHNENGRSEEMDQEHEPGAVEAGGREGESVVSAEEADKSAADGETDGQTEGTGNSNADGGVPVQEGADDTREGLIKDIQGIFDEWGAEADSYLEDMTLEDLKEYKALLLEEEALKGKDTDGPDFDTVNRKAIDFHTRMHKKYVESSAELGDGGADADASGTVAVPEGAGAPGTVTGVDAIELPEGFELRKLNDALYKISENGVENNDISVWHDDNGQVMLRVSGNGLKKYADANGYTYERGTRYLRPAVMIPLKGDDFATKYEEAKVALSGKWKPKPTLTDVMAEAQRRIDAKDAAVEKARTIEEVNKAFNEHLESLIQNPEQKNRTLQLGKTSDFLKAGGVSDADIVLEYDKLERKASPDYKNTHPFDKADIKDLPLALQKPIAVFDNTNGKKNAHVVLTELKKDDNNFIVVLKTEEQNRKGGVVLVVNQITSLYPKNTKGIVYWLNHGKATNINKAKALDWIEALRAHRGTTISNQELIDAAKLVNNFELPKEIGGNSQIYTENFKNFFGDWQNDTENASKVVDNNGEPLVVHHGTQHMEMYVKDGHLYTRYTEPFTVFKEGKGFFTSDRDAAESSARGKQGLYSCYLNIRNPFVIDCKGRDWDAIEGYENPDGYSRVTTDYVVQDIKNNHPEYDGVIFKNVMNENSGVVEYPIDDYVPFKPEQIKSATENVGDFDAKNPDIRFSYSGGKRKKTKDSKTLAGIHNISEMNLRKALGLGGLANPSVAVVDTAKNGHSEFGEISLVLPADKIDARTGNNAGTWNYDVWTPVYPNVRTTLTDQGYAAFKEKVGALDADEAIKRSIRDEIGQMQFGRMPNLAWMYLKERRGIDATEYNHPSLSTDWENILREYKSVGKLQEAINENEELRKKVGGMMLHYFMKKLRDEHPDQYTDVDPNAENAGKAYITAFRANKQKAQEIYGEWKSEDLAEAYNENRKIFRSKKDGVDDYRSMNQAYSTVFKRGWQEDYEQWLDETLKGWGVKEELRNGNDRNGNAKYIPNTLENASMLMNKQKTTGNNNVGGWGTFIAQMATHMKSLDEIREKKGMLGDETDNEDVSFVRDNFSEFPIMLKDKSRDLDLWDGSASKAFADLLKHIKNIENYAKRKYGIELDEEEVADIKEWYSAFKRMPQNYFETKFDRPVGLEEFVAAVVPNKTSADIVQALQDRGLKVYKYNPNVEGSRDRAQQKATKTDGVRFSYWADGDPVKKPTFYSNAAHALEQIKQEKATPEQWLNMLQKNGGLKAGEDKWLGLSEWLKERADLGTKTLTKDEVLDYIRKNEIRIEEVKYGDDEMLSADEIKTRYPEIADVFYVDGLGRDGLLPIQTGKTAKAIDLYNEETGSDIDAYDFTSEEATEVRQWATDFVLEKGEPINDTRLDYTTKGLDNNKEIALVVPTIEPYNESDDVHFGDAGDGRAVAWVRFGDTTANRELTEAEKQEAVQWVPAADQWVKKDGSQFVAKHDLYYLPKDVENKNPFGTTYIADYSDKGYWLLAIGSTEQRFGTIDEAIEGFKTKVAEEANKRGAKQKVLVIDEIQSKRHQDGRESGYRDDSHTKEEWLEIARNASDELGALFEELGEKYNTIDVMPHVTPEEKAKIEALQKTQRDADQQAYNRYDLVPDAPFDKNWHELALKRMLRYAAENGYDKVAWTTGMQQVKRYDSMIQGVVKNVRSGISPDGKRHTIISMTQSENIYLDHDSEGNITKVSGSGDTSLVNNAKTLEEVVGKDLAEKILAQTKMGSENVVTYEGDDITIGNKGMQGFYDQMLPKFMSKYGKKWGAKVGDVELPQLGKDDRIMHSIDVTPEMKESVMQGQPMFMKDKQTGEPGTEMDSEEAKLATDALMSFMEDELGDIVPVHRVSQEETDRMLEKLADIEKSGIAERIDKRIAELNRIKENERLTISSEGNGYEYSDEGGHPNNLAGANRSSNSSAKVNKKFQPSKELAKNLSEYIKNIGDGSNLSAKTFLKELIDGMGRKQSDFDSDYISILNNGNKIRLRLSDHSGNALSIIRKGGKADVGYSVVVLYEGMPEEKRNKNFQAKEKRPLVVTEFVYDNPDGKKMVNIAKSVFNLLDTGEYIDIAGADKITPTPAAKQKEMRRPDGTLYGWVQNGEIYLTPQGINPNSPIHEYGHLWGEYVRRENPELWASVVENMKQSPIWDEVVNSEGYEELAGNEDAIAEETLGRLSGRRGSERLRQMEEELKADESKDPYQKVTQMSALRRLKAALDKLWNWIGKELLKLKKFNSPEEVADRVLYDLLNKTDIRSRRKGSTELGAGEPEGVETPGAVAARDAEYAEAVKSGNKERALEMLEEEADIRYSYVADTMNKMGVKATDKNVHGGTLTTKDGKKTGYVQLTLFDELEKGGAELGAGSGTATTPKRKDSTDLTQLRLRPLQEGEMCYVERRYEESKQFSFMGSEKISSPEDVAYLFKSLETSAIENTFFALVHKKGTTIIHAGMGGMVESYADALAPMMANKELKPTALIFVHNHPSGKLTPSPQDRQLLEGLRHVYGSLLQDGVIIDQTSGQFATFNEYDSEVKQRPQSAEKEKEYKVYSFSKNVFSPDYQFGANRLDDPYSVAAFISSHRLGGRGKLGVLLLSNNLTLNGNVFLTHNELTDANMDDVAHEIVENAAMMSAKAAVVYGSGGMTERLGDKLKLRVKQYSGSSTVHLINAVKVEGLYDMPTSVLAGEDVSPEYGAGMTDGKASGTVAEQTERNKQLERRVEAMAEKLGGAKVKLLGSAEMSEGHETDKGYYDPETGEVVLNVDAVEDTDDAMRTVMHEKIGHEGPVALLGSQTEVNKFGQYIYACADKELRRKIVDKAMELMAGSAELGAKPDADALGTMANVGHGMPSGQMETAATEGAGARGTDADMHNIWSVAAQEVAAEIGEKMMDGSMTAADASLWRKIKMYIIRALKAMGIKVRGLLNDKDLVYYLQRGADKLRGKTSETAGSSGKGSAELGADGKLYRPGDGKPRKRKDETMGQFYKRLGEWERWKDARQDELDPEPPQQYDPLNDEVAQAEYKAAVDDFKAHYGLEGEMPDADPRRKEGETDAELMARIRNFEKWMVAISKPDAGYEYPNDLTFFRKYEDEAKRQYREWMKRHNLLEEENADLALYEGTGGTIDSTAETEHDDLIRLGEAVDDAEANKEMMATLSIDNSPEGMRRAAKMAVIKRRKNLESMSAEDAVFIHELSQKIGKVAKELRVKPKELREALVDMIEGTYEGDILLNDEGLELLEEIKDWYDHWYMLIEDAGLRNDAGFIAHHYINHIWDKEKSEPAAWDNYQRTRSKNMNERTVKTYKDGREVGLVPKFTDVLDIMAYYSRSNAEAVANRRFLDDLKFYNVEEVNDEGEVIAVNPLYTTVEPTFNRDSYQEYYVPGVGKCWVLKEASGRFDNIFGTQRTPGVKGWVTEAGHRYDLIAGTAKKIQLSLSGFHAGALTEVAIAQMGPIRALKTLGKYLVYDSIKSGNLPAFAHPEDFKEAARHLVQLGATADYAAADVNAMTEKVVELTRGIKGVNLVAELVNGFNHGMDTALWSFLHDGLKIATFKMFKEQIMKDAKKNGWSPKKIDMMLDEAGQYVNDTFGGQYWELISFLYKLPEKD